MFCEKTTVRSFTRKVPLPCRASGSLSSVCHYEGLDFDPSPVRYCIFGGHTVTGVGLSSNTSVFACHYRSVNVPLTFVRLPKTLYSPIN